MKTFKAVLFLAATLLGADALAAREVRTDSKAIKPRITHEGLQERQKATLPPSEGRAVTAGELQPTVTRSKEKRGSLIGRSTIISSGTNWTIVPKEAILHVPAHFRSRLNGERHGRLLPWKDFLVLNRNWILVEEVKLEQASGKDPLSEETRKKHQTLSRVVVAVCQGGPISVKKPVVDKPAAPVASVSPGQ